MLVSVITCMSVCVVCVAAYDSCVVNSVALRASQYPRAIVAWGVEDGVLWVERWRRGMGEEGRRV